MASGYEGLLQHKGLKPELVGKLGKCGHMYHLLCLVAMYSNGNKVGRKRTNTPSCDVTSCSKSNPVGPPHQACSITAHLNASDSRKPDRKFVLFCFSNSDHIVLLKEAKKNQPTFSVGQLKLSAK